MKKNWIKKGLTFFLIAAVCCCFMPGMALAAEDTAGAAKAAVTIQSVQPDAGKTGVTVQASADVKDKSQIDIKAVNGNAADAKVQLYLWKKNGTKKEKASDVTLAGMDPKTGEVTVSGTKVKLNDGAEGRYLEFTVNAGKSADLKVKLEPAAKDKSAEVVLEVRTVAAAPADTVAGAQTNANAAANTDTPAAEQNDAQNKGTEGSTTNEPAAATADPVLIEVAVTKVWNDEDDKGKIRPANVTIKLFADGVDTEKTLVLDATGTWKGSFKDLDKQKDGKDIVYTVKEVAVTGYTTDVTGDQTTGFTVTNTPTVDPNKVTVEGTITWDDNDDKNKKRPTKVTIRLFANGEESQLVKVTADDQWKFVFENLDKYDANNKEITYTIKEDSVTNYSTTYKGYDVTNKYKSSSSGSKTSGSTSNKNSSSKNAKTGDSTHMALYLILMLIAVCGACGILFKRRRG